MSSRIAQLRERAARLSNSISSQDTTSNNTTINSTTTKLSSQQTPEPSTPTTTLNLKSTSISSPTNTNDSTSTGTNESFQYINSFGHGSREPSVEDETSLKLGLGLDFKEDQEVSKNTNSSSSTSIATVIPTSPSVANIKTTTFQSDKVTTNQDKDVRFTPTRSPYSIHDPRHSASTTSPAVETRKTVGIKDKSTTSNNFTAFNLDEVTQDTERWFDKKDSSTSEIKNRINSKVSKVQDQHSVQLQEIVRITQEKEESKRELDKARSGIESLLKENKTRESKEIELRQRLAKRKDELSKFKEIEKNFEDVKGRMEEATQDILKLEIAKEKDEKSLEEKENKIYSLEEELKSIQTQLLTLKTKYKNLKEDYRTREREANSKVEELIVTKDQLSKQLNRVGDLEKALNNVVEERVEMGEVIKRLEFNKSETEDLMNTLKNDKKFLEEEVVILSARIESITKEFQTSNSYLTSELSKITSQKETLAVHSSTLRTQIIDLAKTKLELQRQIEEMSINFKREKEALIDNRNKKDYEENRVKKIERERSASQDSIEIKALKERNQLLEQASIESEAIIADLLEELANADIKKENVEASIHTGEEVKSESSQNLVTDAEAKKMKVETSPASDTTLEEASSVKDISPPEVVEYLPKEVETISAAVEKISPSQPTTSSQDSLNAKESLVEGSSAMIQTDSTSLPSTEPKQSPSPPSPSTSQHSPADLETVSSIPLPTATSIIVPNSAPSEDLPVKAEDEVESIEVNGTKKDVESDNKVDPILLPLPKSPLETETLKIEISKFEPEDVERADVSSTSSTPKGSKRTPSIASTTSVGSGTKSKGMAQEEIDDILKMAELALSGGSPSPPISDKKGNDAHVPFDFNSLETNHASKKGNNSGED